MALAVFFSHPFGDTTARYWRDDDGRVALDLVPSALLDKTVARRETLAGIPEIDAIPNAAPPPAISIDPLVHVKIVGDPYTGAFAQGRTMRNGPSSLAFTLHDQKLLEERDLTTIITTLASPAAVLLEHRLSGYRGEPSLHVQTTLRNNSDRPIVVEMLTSFSLANITPFAREDAPDRLRVHRFRSVWSAEGRLDTQSIERLHLERSWSGAGAFSERFGQVGSMPVRGWFPFAAIEDTAMNVLWGAQLAWAGSWQMEIFRQDDQVALSGGLADREFGHWTKTISPGESFTAPAATIACVHGTLDDLCDRLTSAQHRAADMHPAVEKSLPIVFNEWCTTWGDPSHEKIVAIADALQGTPARFLVIDAGWYKTPTGDWNNGHGDWIPSKTLFPDGLAATAAAIRQRGLIPGLWFEFETVGENSAAFALVDHLLKRDGIPITVRSRRFWNFTDAVALRYLTEKVIDLLESCGFGYLKVDYNETIGIGCDDPDSQGEGLRRHIEGVYRFFERIRERLPDLVIECCSSGGHRLEPSMLARTAQASFSDAHELPEIPLIAANLHRLMLPRQSQIWAVLHPADSMQRLLYSLAATFLGRMGLSGGIHELSRQQRDLLLRAMQLYEQAAPIIKHGVSRRFGNTGESWRHLTGWQGVLRVANSKPSTALLVLHSFGDPPARADIPLPPGDWEIATSLESAKEQPARIANGTLTWQVPAPFSATVALLRQRSR